MLSPKGLFLSLVLLFCLKLSGQEVQIVVPQLLEDKVVTNSGGQNVDFYSYPFTSRRIDLRLFKRKYPKLNIPDIVMVDAPKFQGFRDSTVLLSIIKGGRGKSDALILWLAGDYYTNRVTFFIDKNHDRNFLNDGEPLVLNSKDKPFRVVVDLPNSNAVPPELWLSVPEKVDPKIAFLKRLKNRKAKIKNQWAISAYAGFGAGTLNYEFHNLERGFPTWYNVNVTEKQVGLAVSYDMHRFRFGVSATFQNLFFYTSYLNIRFDEPEVVINNGIRTTIENVLVERNQDVHATNRVQWSLMAAMRLFFGEFIELQPMISGGITSHFSSGYVKDRQYRDEKFAYKSSPFIELGLQMEFTTSPYKAFFVGIAANHLWWDPEGFFDTYQYENLQTRFLIWKGVLGYRIAIQ